MNHKELMMKGDPNKWANLICESGEDMGALIKVCIVILKDSWNDSCKNGLIREAYRTHKLAFVDVIVHGSLVSV